MKDSLDLTQENDLFVLFALAGAWSHTGAWENGAYFAAYLKNSSWTVKDWGKQDFCDRHVVLAKQWLDDLATKVKIDARKKISFRVDFLDTIRHLSEKWNEINTKLSLAQQTSDWRSFADYMTTLKILDKEGKKGFRIKIPFILRELRCQGIYQNICGELCCVADDRVREVYKNRFLTPLPKNYLSASKEIYQDWGNLYDMPAFALFVDDKTGQRDMEVVIECKVL